MRLSWRVAAAAVIGGLWATPASAFHKHVHHGGAAVTTVSVPSTITTTTTRASVATVPFVGSAGISSINGFSSIGGISSISALPTISGVSSIHTFPTTISSINSFPAISGISSLHALPTVGSAGITYIPAGTSNVGTAANVGDIATLNASIQSLNTTMQQTNQLLARLVGDDDPAVPVRAPGGIPNVPPDPSFGTASISSIAATPRLPYHLYAERQIEAAILAKDAARVGYYYHKNNELTEQRIKEMRDTQQRIADKIKASGLTVPVVPK